MEAHWETNTKEGAPFAIIALPDMEAEKNLFEMNIPNGLSLLVTHSPHDKVLGLKAFPREDRPNVFILFWSFRLMVAIGFILFFIMVWAGVLWRRGRLYESRPFLWALLVVHPLGFLATELGWITNEVGRQPWLVYHLLRTSEGYLSHSGRERHLVFEPLSDHLCSHRGKLFLLRTKDTRSGPGSIQSHSTCSAARRHARPARRKKG